MNYLRSDPGTRTGASAILCSLTLVLIYMGYPLVSFVSLVAPGLGREISIVYRLVCILLCVLIGVRQLSAGQEKEGGSGAWKWLMLAFWTVYMVRMVYDYRVAMVEGPMGMDEYAAYTIGTGIIPMFTMLWIGDERRLRFVPHFVVGVGLATCILAAWAGVSYYEADMSGRLVANERLNPITLGHSAAVTVFGLLWLMLFRRREKRGPSSTGDSRQANLKLEAVQGAMPQYWRLPVGIMAVSLSLYVLILAASRSPTIGLVFGLLLFGLRLRTRMVYVALIAALAAVAFYQMGFLDRLAELNIATSRLLTLGNEQGDFEGGRGDMYFAAWQMFTSSPAFGESLFVFGFAYPHNLFLEALMSTGVLGGLLLGAMMVRGALGVYRASVRGNVGFFLLLLFAQAFIGTMTSGSIYYDPMFWPVLGVGLGLSTTRIFQRLTEESTIRRGSPSGGRMTNPNR